MKLLSISILSFLAVLSSATGLPEPVADPAPTVYSGAAIDIADRHTNLEKRDNQGTVLVDGLKYRPCPRVIDACAAKGEYAKGTKITIECYSRTATTTVKGDAGWARLKNGYWVALAGGTYVAWKGSIPLC